MWGKCEYIKELERFFVGYHRHGLLKGPLSVRFLVFETEL